MKDLLGIISWSFTCLHARFFPASPMPGQKPFNTWRQKQAGKPLNAGGMLIEIRGDWDAYKNWFGLAGWNTTNCCYRCQATSEDIRDPSLTAAWRSQRKTLWQHLQERNPCSPFLVSQFQTFVIDWLHCMDLGMAADFAGNLLFHALPCFPGRDIKQQCKVLHWHLQSWYRTNPGWPWWSGKRMPRASTLPQSSGLVLEKWDPWCHGSCNLLSALWTTTNLWKTWCWLLPSIWFPCINAWVEISIHLLKWPLTVESFCSCMWNWKRILLKDSGSSSQSSTWHRNCVSMIW